MRSDRYRQRVAAHVAHREFRAALAILDAWRAREPDSIEPELLHAQIDFQHGALRAAAARAREAVRERDCPPELALDVVQCLRLLAEHDALIEWAEAWPHRGRLPASDLANIGAALESIGAHALAVEWIEQAVAQAPGDAACRVNRAFSRSYAGDFDGARADAEAAIASAGDPAVAHWLLARLVRAASGLDHVDRLRARLRDADALDAEYLHFALFKQLDELGDTDAAWSALEAGCRLVRARRPYDPDAAERLFGALRARFPLDAPIAEPRPEAPQSIFLVGLHRSGTTLLESMLSASPAVCSLGETRRLGAALRHAADRPGAGVVDAALIDAADTLDWNLVRDRFLETDRRRIGDARHVTEKLPDNFLLVGFIRHALPTAKIVHLRRDPMDLCFANLRELFPDTVAHAYAQEDLAHYHGLHVALMRHWNTIHPGFVLKVDYEDLVRDPLATSRRVYEFCGLDWAPRVVDPAAWSGQAIHTLSSVQARQPVHTASIDRWRRYADRLEPLRRALGAPSRLRSGAPAATGRA